MIIEKILGNRKTYAIGNRKIDTVGIEWYESEKKLLRKTITEGEEIGIRISPPIQDGDVLYADDSRVIVAEILPSELTVVHVYTMREMGRLCFELGNRHLSLSIGENEVSVPYDEPTFAYLAKLGFAPEKKLAKFTHFTVCHAHGHSHDHEEHHHEEAHEGQHDHEHTHHHDHTHVDKAS